jgi:LemA protein
MPPSILIPLVLALSLFLGWLFLFLAKRRDREGFLYERAPSLPIHLLAEHDDAWIQGVIEAKKPLQCPWFHAPCCWYSYKIEEEETRTITDSDGNTRTETSWETIFSESKSCPFDLVGKKASIQVLPQDFAIKSSVSTGYDYEWGSRRHSARILPIGQRVTILGVKLENGAFGKLGQIPCLITFKTREAFVKGTHQGEKWFRWLGFFCLFAGGVATVALLTGIHRAKVDWILAVGGGTLLLTPFWFSSTYNRFIQQRQQVDAAWSQIDVDLGVRFNLIPQLVAVVKGYQMHERQVFEGLSQLRAGKSIEEKIKGDKLASRLSQSLLALEEAYPELKADQNYQSLHEKLVGLEEKLATSRGLYNSVTKEWNDLCQGFPTILLALIFGFKPRPYFQK